MSTDTQQSAQGGTGQIHGNLGGAREFKWGLTGNDIAIMAIPSTVVIIILGLPFTPSSLTLPLFGLSVLCLPVMGLLYKSKPAHLTLSESLISKLRWRFKKKEYRLGTNDIDDSLHVTQIDEVRSNSVRRNDGALVGAVKVEPANMALETEEAWAQAVSSFTSFANSTLGFKSQIYITGQKIDPEDHIGQLRTRLETPAVRERPVLAHLIERFVSWYSGRLEEQGAHTREYYLIVPVTDRDVEAPGEADDSFRSTLVDVPVVGRVVQRFTSSGESLTDGQRERLKQQKLENRLQDVRKGVTSVHGCHADPVNAHEFAQVLKEYWDGEKQEYGSVEQALGSLPVVDTHNESEFSIDGVEFPDWMSELGEDVDAELSGFVSPDDSSEHAKEKRATVAESKLNELKYDMKKNQKSFFAPATIDWERDHAVVDGDTFMRTYWVEQFPENPTDGFLERVLLESSLNTDLSIHLRPFSTASALDALSDWISGLEVTHQELRENGEVRADDYEEDIQRAKQIRQMVRSNQTSLFRGGIYLRVTADSVDDLRQQSRELESILRDVPANTTPKQATRWQERGLVTVSPLGLNRLGDNRMSAMTGSAVGSMFPFSSNYYMDPDGIEYGIHGHNGTPVLIDPFELGTGSNELVAGDIGSGKTVTVKKNITRTLQARDDVKVVMLDPVREFAGLVDAFGGDTVLVGGQTKINPLHIEKTPQAALDRANGKLDPLSAKKDEVMSFLDNFFAMEGVTVDNKRGVLRYAIGEVYSDADITSNVQTHSRPSPTIMDLVEKLGEIAEAPGEHDIVSSKSGHQSVVDTANELEIALQAFKEGGAYHNLAQESTVDILSENSEEPMVYIDLQQEDGRGEGNTGFMMQLLLSTVYQQAKKIDEKVVFAIDEAHYLLRDKQNLDYIQQIIRHSRHVDMRMILASQTLEEFYKNEDARTISNQCSIKVFHKLSGLSSGIADELELSQDQVRFIRSAAAGKEDLGYSEALVQIKEHGEYPIQVRLNDLELELLAHNMDAKTLLGSLASSNEDRDKFRSFLENDGAVRTLFEYYDLPQSKAQQIVDEGVTYQQVVDALIELVTRMPEDQTNLKQFNSKSDADAGTESVSGDEPWQEQMDWSETHDQ